MRKRIGDIFVEKGLMSHAQLDEALAFAREKGLRLGDAAVKLGSIKPETLGQLFGPSNVEDFFYLDVNYFPAVTRDVFDIPTIVKYGVLPLGFKTEQKLFRSRKRLNLGLISPERKADALPDLERLAKAKLGANSFQDFKIYLILAEQLVDVLEKKYAFPEAKLRTAEMEMDDRLVLYLDSAKG